MATVRMTKQGPVAKLGPEDAAAVLALFRGTEGGPRTAVWGGDMGIVRRRRPVETLAAPSVARKRK